MDCENCSLPLGGLSEIAKHSVEIFTNSRLERFKPQSTPQYNQPTGSQRFCYMYFCTTSTKPWYVYINAAW
jgi:hypothetical protein